MAQGLRSLIVIVGLSCVTGASTPVDQASSGQTYTLDLVSEPLRRTDSDAIASKNLPSVTASPSGITTHTPQARIPFEITFSLDRSGYVIGDDVVYEMLLKHTGSVPFHLPWARDPETVRGAARIETAVFMLYFKDEAFGRQIVGAENTLFGSRSIPASMLELKPGDTLRVRAASRWYLMSGNFPKPPGDGWLRDLSVRAQLGIAGVNDLDALLDSGNAVLVQLGQR